MTKIMSTVDYKKTVFLPQTDFPMKAQLAEREPNYLAHWNQLDLYQTLRKKSKGKEKFVLHFGPPYANGHIHIGHALSEILKDITNKIKQMQGFDAPLVPGWDCHGLPIEWQIEKQYQAKGLRKDDIDPITFRQECRTFAKEWVAIQKEEFKRLGIIGDWDNPYSTMDFASEGAIVAELGKFLMNGTLFRGMRPVMWSVIEKTALAEAEVEYKDHTSDAIYVAFPLTQTDVPILDGAHAVIWTTTPWSLPGNRAIAYGHFDYVVIEHNEKKLIIAEALLEAVLSAMGLEDAETKILAKIPGEKLKNTVARHPLYRLGYTFDVPFFFGDHVTTEAGTGLVHTAPSHGMEDFILGKKHNLPVPNTVGPDGFYTHEVPHFQGIHVFKANVPIIDALKETGALIHQSKLTHSYPHSWRSKAPLIYRATHQWFIDVKQLRSKAMDAVAATHFIPEQGRHRIAGMVESRPDWCISRQRAWGTPLTLFVHKKTNELLRDEAVHARIVEKINAHGADVWFTTPAQEFLGDDYHADDYEQIFDVIDVWFDSGCTNAFVLEAREELKWPADVYFEGSDQHRGWFQSSLWHGVGTRGRAPYDTIVTHGFVLDEKGYKMSKSQGNVVAPEDVIKTYGADILRLWVASVDYSDDVRIGKDILKQMEDMYRRFRNTLRYLLGALSGFEESEHLPYDAMPELERSILHRLSELQRTMNETAKTFNFSAFYTELHHFCTSDLSAFYFDLRKDSLYCDDTTSLKRRAVRTVMDTLFHCLTRWLAPVLSFTAEEAYLSHAHNDRKTSIHLETFVALPEVYFNQTLAAKWEKLRHYRRVMTGALEVERAAKTIGSSLQAALLIYTTPAIAALFEGIDLAEFAITSTATLLIDTSPAHAFTLSDVPDLSVVVRKAGGGKCERCWRILEEVTMENAICGRCEDAIEG